MTAQCSTCFFGQTGQDFSLRGRSWRRVCRKDTPAGTGIMLPLGVATWLWPPVADDDWCGDGMDAETLAPFAPAPVNPV